MATRTISTRIQLDGEQEFKKQMSSVNGELRNLKSEMALADATFKGQANTMEALTEKDRILRGEIEQQREKVRALEQAVKDSSEAFGDTSSKTDGYRQSLNRAKAELIRMNGELEDTDKYLEEAKASSDGCAKSIDGFGKATKGVSDSVKIFSAVLLANLTGDSIKNGIKSLGKAILGLPIGTVKGLASAFSELSQSVYGSVTAAAAYADDILTTSTVTGLSTQAIQEYKYMAELTDVSLDTITGSMTKLTRNMEAAKGGTGAAADAFNTMGISVVNADGSLRNNQAVFSEVIQALGEMENSTQRDAYSMEIFGKSAQDLNPLIAQGAEGIASFAQEANDLGYVLDDETLSALGDVDDAMQRFQNTLDAAKNQLGAEFAPAVETILTGVTQLISGNVDEGMETIQKGIDQIGEILDRLGPAAEEALDKFLDTLAENFPEIAASGMEIILSLIVGIAKAAPELIPAALKALTVIVDTLWENRGQLSEAGQALIQGLWEGIASMGEWIGEKIRGFGQGVVDELKNFFGIRSPSALMRDQVGKYLAAGVGEGFVKEMGHLQREMAESIPSNFEVAARLNTDLRPSNSPATASDLQQVTAAAVNAINLGSNDSGRYVIEVKMNVDGKEFYRETIDDFRAVAKSNPEVR